MLLEIIVDSTKNMNRVTMSMLFYWFQDDFFQVPLVSLSPSQDVTNQNTSSNQNNSNSNNNNNNNNNENSESNSVVAVSSLDWIPAEKQKKIANLLDLANQYEIRYKYDWTPNPKLPL